MAGDDQAFASGKPFDFRELLEGPAAPKRPFSRQAVPTESTGSAAGADSASLEAVMEEATATDARVEDAAPAVETATPAAVEAEFDPLPRAGDAYKAHARPSNKPELMLGLMLNTVPLEIFSYSDLRRARLLEPQTPGGGPVLWLKFVEAEITEVLIEGRNLMTLTEYVQMHRVRWLRECPKGKEPKDPAAAVITRIIIRAVDA